MENTQKSPIQARQHAAPERVSERPSVAPRVDVFENEKELLVVADVPGVAKDDLHIHVEKGTLILEARRSHSTKGTGVVAEYFPRDYRRAFALPPGLDYDRIEARLSNGVLSLTLPKPAALQPRRIEVRSS